jgi:hypothetical protein
MGTCRVAATEHKADYTALSKLYSLNPPQWNFTPHRMLHNFILESTFSSVITFVDENIPFP